MKISWPADEAAAERAHDDSAMRPEPAERDRGAEDVRHRARPDADDDAPEQVELPELGHDAAG